MAAPNTGSLRDLMVAMMSNDNATRSNAERTAKSIEHNVGFTLELLRLIASLSQSASPEDAAIRQIAATYFKNVIRRLWKPNEDQDSTPVPDSDRGTIKVNLVDLMCNSPKAVQKQLGEAVAIIAKYDFPDNWDFLLTQLVDKLASNDLNTINGVMSTTNSLLKRYRYSVRTNDLMRELIFCLKTLPEPLTRTFKSMTAAAMEGKGNKQQLELIMETNYQMVRIFYSLNYQDLPEFFEDHMTEWMDDFAKYLTFTHPLLVDNDEENESGVIERTQAAIIENLNLYASKYEEEFAPHLPKFTQLIWGLLVQVSNLPKYDAVSTQAIKYLTAVCSKNMYSNLFTDAVLKDVVEKIVVKNLMVTERDEELFEENPFDYVRKDMEGSDAETRRRAATELVRALLKLFGPKTTELCVAYVGSLIQQHATNPAANWKLKDAALHLIQAVAIVTTSAAQGAGELNANVNLGDLFSKLIFPELAAVPAAGSASGDVAGASIGSAIIKADVIKLISLFRSHLDAAQLSGTILPLMVQYIASKHVVVQTYAASCIEKMLALKQRNPTTGVSTPKLTKSHVSAHLQVLCGNLFSAIEVGGDGSAGGSEQAENDYVMKCMMRVLLVIGTDMLSALEFISNKLTTVLARVCKSPINPQFNHYLFECIAVMIRTGCDENASASAAASAATPDPAVALTKPMIAANCAKFEQLLFPSFQLVLAQDVTEFVPYVFQILAQLLYYRPVDPAVGPGRLSEAYKALFPPLLSPVLWERKGNIPALMELFQAYIIQGMQDIVANNFLSGVLGIFQKLLAAKSTEQHAFTLLTLLFRYNAYSTLEPMLPTIFQLVLNRMMNNKTPRFFKMVSHMVCVCVLNYGAMAVFSKLEGIQPNLLLVIVEQVFNTQLPFICSSMDYVTACEMLLGCAQLLRSANPQANGGMGVNGQPDVDTVPLFRDNTSNIWGSVMRNALFIAQKGATLSPSAGTKQLVEADGNAGDPWATLSSLGSGGDSAGGDFDNAYSKLVYAGIPSLSDIVVNGRSIVPQGMTGFAFASGMYCTSLGGLMRSAPGVFAGQIRTTLTAPEHVAALQQMLTAHQVSIQ